MTDFQTVFTNEAARLGATAYGQAFTGSGFHYEHTGGGCTAWAYVPSADSEITVLITSAESDGDSLMTAEQDGTHWIVGLVDYREERQSDDINAISAVFTADQLDSAVAFAEACKALADWIHAGQPEADYSARDSIARAFMATRPELPAMSLDEWMTQHADALGAIALFVLPVALIYLAHGFNL